MSVRKVSALTAELSPSASGETSSLQLWSEGTQRHGLWEMRPSVLENVCGPETVVILAGKAAVVIGDESHAIGAGDVLTLNRGKVATWHVQETVRMFYVINGEV